MSPLFEVGFRCVTHRRVARKPCGYDELSARTQQFYPRLITDLHAPAREQRNAPAQIRRLRALAEIQLRARRTKLVVKVMDGGVILFADVATLRLDHFAEVWIIFDLVLLEILRRKNVRRREDFFATQLADTSLVE